MQHLQEMVGNGHERRMVREEVGMQDMRTNGTTEATIDQTTSSDRRTRMSTIRKEITRK